MSTLRVGFLGKMVKIMVLYDIISGEKLSNNGCYVYFKPPF